MSMLKKWDEVFEEYKTIIHFLEWFQQTKNGVLAEWVTDNTLILPLDRPIPIGRTNLEIISEYLEVDQAQLERERRQLLESIRNSGETPT